MEVSFFVSLSTGVMTFFTPCILPLVPVYLGYLGAETNFNKKHQYYILNTLFFCFGFSIIFILLGATASIIGQLLNDYRETVNMVFGVIMIVFSLYMLDIINIPLLMRQKKFFSLKTNRKIGLVTSLLLGIVFATGWTPCVSPILSGILGLAATKATFWEGIYLLSIYSVGLSIPFILLAVLFEELYPLINKIKPHSAKIVKICGLIFFAFGLYLLRLW